MDEAPDKLAVLSRLLHVQRASIKFCEPVGTAREAMLNSILAGTYTKPFLIEEEEYRSMCFALDGTQSEMRLDSPDDLVNEYTRKMMGFLMLRPYPNRMLILGLGGGSLIKYCHRHLMTTHITTVEISADVIALRSAFLVPPDGARLKVIHADGAEHVAGIVERDERTDVILVDAFDHAGIAKAVVERSFIEKARQVLDPGGIFVMNLVAEFDECEQHTDRIRRVFGDPVFDIPMKGEGNRVVFAGPALRDERRLAQVACNANRIESELGLSFPTLRQRLNDLNNTRSLGMRQALR